MDISTEYNYMKEAMQRERRINNKVPYTEALLWAKLFVLSQLVFISNQWHRHYMSTLHLRKLRLRVVRLPV